MPQLSSGERQFLLTLVRETVRAHLSGISHELPPVPAGPLHDPLGVFISIHQGLELRGCIGRVAAENPLYESARECGIAAATADPRFPPLGGGELDRVTFEVSVLSAPEPAALDAIEIGRHGLIVALGRRRGLLLPQVALRQGWDRSEFLSQACLKAGLQPDIWRNGAQVFIFEALVFAEDGSD